jgi:predicted phosphoribosyltransferase
MSHFRNRREAGRLLARALEQHRDEDVVVFGMSRGGMPVAFEIAAALQAPLDVFVVRTIAVPGQESLVMGAAASGGVRVVVPEVVTRLGISKVAIESASAREWHELIREERQYRGELQAMDVRGRTAILVDDGLSSAPGLRAAAMSLKRQKPARLVVAAPALPTSTCDMLSKLVDEIVCATAPEPYLHVGSRYDQLSPVSDDEVRSLLIEGAREHVALASGAFGR